MSTRATILAGCTAVALLGLQSAHAQASCTDALAAVENDLTKREAYMASPKDPRSRQLLAARKLLEQAKEARDNGKEKRCQNKVAAAKRQLPK